MIKIITISDSDVIHIDDVTGNIVIPVDKLPDKEEREKKDLIQIHYVEDLDNIIHEYYIEDFDIDNQTVSLTWKKQLEESLITESPVVKLEPSDMVDPLKVDLKNNIKTAIEKERLEVEQQAKIENENKLREAHKDVIDKLHRSLGNGDSVEETLDVLFDELVPSVGPADSVAGELVRAIVRILYRDHNDGDKFFEGYGLETCGSSAQYLFDHGFDEEIQDILDRAYQLADDDEQYTAAITTIGEHIIDEINNDNSLLWTINKEDSRDYANNYIVENQPRYEFEIEGSDDVVTLVEKGILDSWDLIRYVEEILSYEAVYNDADVSRPWGYHDTSVTVTNLTKDGYEYLQDVTRNSDTWWEGLTSNYADELSDETDNEEY